MNAGGLATFWLLFGRFGPTMTMEQLRDTFFPAITMKTMRNKAAAGQLPGRRSAVFDTRDVADWWDEQRKEAAA